MSQLGSRSGDVFKRPGRNHECNYEGNIPPAQQQRGWFCNRIRMGRSLCTKTDHSACFSIESCTSGSPWRATTLHITSGITGSLNTEAKMDQDFKEFLEFKKWKEVCCEKNDDTNNNNNNNNFFKKILKFLSSGKFILKFLLKTRIFIVRRKIRRTKKKFGKNRKNCKTGEKKFFLQTTPFLPPQAQKQAPAAAVTPSKELPAADQLVHTPTQLAQDPVRQLDLSATDSPRSALGSPLSEMSGYKLSSHEKVVLEERQVNPMLLKCPEDDVDIPGPSTPIYTDPTMVHMTLNHAFGGCRNKLTKQHQSMSLDAWVTANQLAGQRPFGVPLTEKQRNNPPRQPPVPSNALLKILGVIWKLHGVVELHAEAGEWMLWFSSSPAAHIWTIPIPEGKQKGIPPVTSAPPPAMKWTSAPLQEPSEPPSPVAAAPNWSATLMAAVTAGLQEKATKQRQYEVGNL